MLNYGDCKIEDIPDYNGEKVDTIRVCFHKKDADNAMNFCRSLKNKGYNVFVQPMSTFRYTDEELKKLIKSANEFLPKAFYMVDSCGVMNKEDVKRMFNIIDESLDPNISIGVHSHNNLQLSFSNAKELLNLNTQRNMIIDSSVFGMGRGSGNLCTELLMQQLNTDCEKKYKLNPIYKIFDEHLNDIYQKTSWGYSMPLFISAKYNCHPNYAIFLKNYNVNINDIDKIISKIEDSKKSVYDGQYIKNLYEEFLNQRQYDCIAFDLDGTLIDSSEGIYNAIRYVEKNLNISKLDEDTLKLCIGPPLKYTYGVLHNLNDELLNKAIILHKKYMSEKGYKECKVYDGVEELLRYLKSIDKKLVVTTLKQENIAKQTLEHLGISKYFDLILGQNTSESLQKTNLLNEVQKVYNTKNIVLVGDSKFDGEAAMKSKANFIALTFGFGFKNLNDANKYKPISTCNSVYELKNVLLK